MKNHNKIISLFLIVLIFVFSIAITGCKSKTTSSEPRKIEKSSEEFKIGSFYTPINGGSSSEHRCIIQVNNAKPQ